MGAVFLPPWGLAQPDGLSEPPKTASPWPLSPAQTNPSLLTRKQARDVAREFKKMSLGPGGVPVRICFCEDLSGSMGSIASARETVVRGLLTWCQTNLTEDDELALTSFGGDACVRMRPTQVGQKVEIADAHLSSYATMLGPTWRLLAGFPATQLRTVSVGISDGLVADLGRDGGKASAVYSGVDEVVLILPEAGAYSGEAPRCWSQSFPNSPVYAVQATEATQLAHVMAQVVAAATGRELVIAGPKPRRPAPGSVDQTAP